MSVSTMSKPYSSAHNKEDIATATGVSEASFEARAVELTSCMVADG